MRFKVVCLKRRSRAVMPVELGVVPALLAEEPNYRLKSGGHSASHIHAAPIIAPPPIIKATTM